MDYYQESGVKLQEQKPGHKGLWWIIIILILLVVGFMGIRKGWYSFGSNQAQNEQQIEDYGSPDPNQVVNEKNYAPINLARVDTTESFPVQKHLVLSGDLPNGCTYLNTPTQFRDGNIFYISLTTRVEESDFCTQALTPYEKSIPLNVGGLPAGTYIANINNDRELSFEIDQNNNLDFTAGSDK